MRDRDEPPRLDRGQVDHAGRTNAGRQVDVVDGIPFGDEVTRRVHMRAAMRVEFQPLRVPALDFEGLCLVDLDAPHAWFKRKCQVDNAFHVTGVLCRCRRRRDVPPEVVPPAQNLPDRPSQVKAPIS